MAADNTAGHTYRYPKRKDHEASDKESSLTRHLSSTLSPRLEPTMPACPQFSLTRMLLQLGVSVTASLLHNLQVQKMRLMGIKLDGWIIPAECILLSILLWSRVIQIYRWDCSVIQAELEVWNEKGFVEGEEKSC